MGQYDKKRARIRLRAQQPPWDFSPGLAHVLATVAEPRSDDAASNTAFDAYVDAHRSQLVEEIDAVVASVNESDRALKLGGQVENVLDRAAEGLKRVAQKYGIDDVTERLMRLEDERRLGVSDSDHKVEITNFTMDVNEIPRSSVSDRRVGLWR